MKSGPGLLLLAAILACLSLAPVSPSPAQEADPHLDFAHALFKEGDYFRAVTEAKRFIFLKPQDPRRLEAELLIARAYYEAGQYAQARTAYEPLIRRTDRLELAATAALESGRCLERLDPAGQAVEYYRRLAEDQSPPDLRNTARYRLGWLLLEAGRWSEAREAFSSVEDGHSLKTSARRLADQVPAGENLDYRSPQAAGAFSAVLPGAGQLYVGRPVDAGLAFILNAAFIWATVQAAQDRNWAAFGILGLMEVGWYGGNIYNAVNGAHIHNREVQEEFRQKLRRDHGWRLGYDPRNLGPLVSWSVDF
ncbi:MAG: tetratricopeptide repeat protein [Thermodesulfobacteriota bacterium]